MNINPINNLNFKANYIKDAQVKKYNSINNSYEPVSISFVEMEPDNIRDFLALKDVVKYWPEEKYASNIAHSLYLLGNNTISRDSYKIYALTTQKNKFYSLNSNEILAIGEVSEKIPEKVLELDYLQVDPQLIYSFSQKEYKGVGSAFLNALKEFETVQSIFLKSVRSAVNFYKKNDFELIDNKELKLLWKK